MLKIARQVYLICVYADKWLYQIHIKLVGRYISDNYVILYFWNEVEAVRNLVVRNLFRKDITTTSRNGRGAQEVDFGSY